MQIRQKRNLLIINVGNIATLSFCKKMPKKEGEMFADMKKVATFATAFERSPQGDDQSDGSESF